MMHSNRCPLVAVLGLLLVIAQIQVQETIASKPAAFVRSHVQSSLHKESRHSRCPVDPTSLHSPFQNVNSISKSSSSALAYTVSPEPIHTAFSVATFGPQVGLRNNFLKWKLKKYK